MAEFTKEQLIEEVNYNLEHCFCSDKTKRLMEIALAALTETQLPQPAVLSVSEGVLKSLLPDVEKSEFWFEHNGKIFFEGVRFNNAVFEACRAAMLQGAELVSNRDELPDGWVACSERMPEKADEVLCAKEFDGPGDWRQKVGYYLAGKWTVYSASWTPTHWMPLPAAPRQEVK
ncbi:DUF551 domain-containing protein [Escherichia coli]|uniref:DUF551 domain-containing protein n=1 Tax=Escherichia coli TaxID=562 RepID=UPI000BE3C894|nr:DUF551 domain-containing protein [Escherichia coli]BES10126.1 hypothetical protein Ef18B006LT_32210 [Escherichia fergusonii]HDR9824410.1 DUF551 domain-containing protein [Escherichia coli C186-61 (10h)]EGF2663890.1 DUF551 domain-containing protein [Escherichia coli]EHB7664557.1 DUF551 domain-containing protein [Escherichia coli]MCH0655129.1 DUF551 domain-containing protein [Escherichia coli]